MLRWIVNPRWVVILSLALSLVLVVACGSSAEPTTAPPRRVNGYHRSRSSPADADPGGPADTSTRGRADGRPHARASR